MKVLEYFALHVNENGWMLGSRMLISFTHQGSAYVKSSGDVPHGTNVDIMSQPLCILLEVYVPLFAIEVFEAHFQDSC